MRIAFAGGGTGGHVLPVQSLIKHLDNTHNHTHSLFRFGEKPSLEYTTYKNLRKSIHGLHFVPIHSGKWRREKELSALIKNIRDLFFLGIGVLEALIGLIYYRIDVVFCKGGYVSLPVVLAGWILRKRIFLHESDTKPGLANRICSRFTNVVFTGFSGVFPDKEIVVGQILDDDLVIGGNNSHFRFLDQFDKTKSHFLVTGGSQGSESVYKALYNILHHNTLSNSFFHIILGTKNTHLSMHFSGLQHIKTYDFVDQSMMGGLLKLCDVAITRGGTTSLAEQQLFGIKKIIIPIPWTHDQFKNAQRYKNTYDDISLDQQVENFEQQLKEYIQQYSSYKKPTYPNPLKEIQNTKNRIIEYVLG